LEPSGPVQVCTGIDVPDIKRQSWPQSNTAIGKAENVNLAARFAPILISDYILPILHTVNYLNWKNSSEHRQTSHEGKHTRTKPDWLKFILYRFLVSVCVGAECFGWDRNNA